MAFLTNAAIRAQLTSARLQYERGDVQSAILMVDGIVESMASAKLATPSDVCTYYFLMMQNIQNDLKIECYRSAYNRLCALIHVVSQF